MGGVRGILAWGGRILTIVLITLVLLELVLRVGYPLTPAPFREYLVETLPPEELPAHVGETGWALRGFLSHLEQRRASTYVSNLWTDADLYTITCMSPPDVPPERVTVQYDEFGFRQDQTYPLWRDDPDVLVLGDSFSAATMIGNPFWQDVSQRVWGLGVEGIGPVEQANILRAMLETREVAPRVIVVQYFEGNDLIDAYAYPPLAAEYTAPQPPPSTTAPRSYTVQAARYLLDQIAPPPPEPLPAESSRTFQMFLDNPPPSDERTTLYTGDRLWGWALDTRNGLADGTGIARVRLHAGATCDGPLLDEDIPQDSFNRYRPDIVNAFNLPQPLRFTGFQLSFEAPPGDQTITVCAESEAGDVIQQSREVRVEACPLPLTTRADEEIGFSPLYLGIATLSSEAITATNGYAQTEAALLKMQQMADEVGAELVLLYLPSKIHTYIDLMDDAELESLGDMLRAYGRIDDQLYTEFSPRSDLDPADVVRLLRENVGDQRSVIQVLAIAHDIPFVDATPALRASAALGEQPFHPADTHINNAGSAVVREVLRAALAPYLEETP